MKWCGRALVLVALVASLAGCLNLLLGLAVSAGSDPLANTRPTVDSSEARPQIPPAADDASWNRDISFEARFTKLDAAVRGLPRFGTVEELETGIKAISRDVWELTRAIYIWH